MEAATLNAAGITWTNRASQLERSRALMQRLDDEHEKNLLGAIDYDNTIQWAKYFQRMATTPEAFEGQDHPVGFAVVLELVAKGLAPEAAGIAAQRATVSSGIASKLRLLKDTKAASAAPPVASNPTAKTPRLPVHRGHRGGGLDAARSQTSGLRPRGQIGGLIPPPPFGGARTAPPPAVHPLFAQLPSAQRQQQTGPRGPAH